MDKVLITGINGQTGSYLAELFLEKGLEVHGTIRRSSSFTTNRIDHIYDKLKLHYADMSDYGSLIRIIENIKPEFLLNTACQSHVRVSFDIPEYTMDVGATGVIRCLEAIRHYSPHTRILQCSTSEMFGDSPPPQNENTPFKPRSPYACAKVAGYHSVVNYREAYDLFAVNAVTFNHESPRRLETFVTRKITRAATRIKYGLQNELVLGNLDAARDWSHAKDVAQAMWMILNHDAPDDWVVSTGEMHTVKEFLNIVFEKLDLDPNQYVKFDPRYLRPTEVPALCGDSSKIRKALGWKPSYSFEDLVEEMVAHDLKLAEQEKRMK